VPKERVTHSDRIAALLDERLKQKKRIEELEEKLREYEIEETIYKSKDKPDLGDPFR
jgi:cell division septum initiation protein DivIVA